MFKLHKKEIFSVKLPWKWSEVAVWKTIFSLFLGHLVLMTWNLNFKFRIVFWNIFFWRFGVLKKRIALSEKSHLYHHPIVKCNKKVTMCIRWNKIFWFWKYSVKWSQPEFGRGPFITSAKGLVNGLVRKNADIQCCIYADNSGWVGQKKSKNMPT